MNIFADRYQFRARIIPEFLAVLPLVVLLVVSVKDILVLGFLSFALFFIFFQGYFSSRLGRQLQDELLKEGKLNWGSTFLLQRYEKNSEDKYVLLLQNAVNKFNAVNKSNVDDPFTLTEEQRKAEEIDKIIDWLREQTRDKESFPAVFDKNCDFGFDRNMLALRCHAIRVLVLAIILLFLPTLVIQTTPMIGIDLTHPLINNGKLLIWSVWFLLIIAWVIFWTRVVSIESLNKSSEYYIKSLLHAVDGVESTKSASS